MTYSSHRSPVSQQVRWTDFNHDFRRIVDAYWGRA